MESIYDLYNPGPRTKYQGVLHFSFSLNSSMVHPISLPLSPSPVPSFSLMALNGFITEHRNPGSVERVEARLFGREERSPLASLLSGQKRFKSTDLKRLVLVAMFLKLHPHIDPFFCVGGLVHQLSWQREF